MTVARFHPHPAGLTWISVGLLPAAFVGATVAVAASVWGSGIALAGIILIAGGLACVVLAIRTPWWPVALYWVVYSTVGVNARLVTQIRIGEFPLTLPDIAVGLMALSVVANAIRDPPDVAIARPMRFIGWCVALDTVLSALIGLIHGHQLYALLIDLRTMAYLAVGYIAGRMVADRPGWTKRVTMIMWTTVVGFGIVEGAALLGALGRFQVSGGQLADYKDIGVPYFTGKYGLFLALITVARRGFSRAPWAFGLAMMGAAATVLSFVRTAWAGVAAGLLLLAVLAVRRRAIFGVRVALVAVAVAACTVFLIEISPQGSTLLEASQSRLSSGFVGGSTGAETVATRVATSSFALAQLQGPLDWLVGRGLGLPGLDSPLPYLENSFVWLLAKEGLIGLTIFSVGLLLIPIRWGYRANPRDSLSSTLLLVLLAAQVGNIASGYASGNLLDWELAPLVGMTLAWIVALSRQAMVAEFLEDPWR